MRGFIYALQFLTIIPLRTAHAEGRTIASGLIYFPVVGLFLGIVLAACTVIMTSIGFNNFASAATAVILLVVLTRGLHMDGLSDTADALLSCGSKVEMLKIMRDPCAGVMGTLAVISVILLKIAFLSSISAPHRALALVIMCVLGRWSMVYSVFAFPYARSDGKAGPFIDAVTMKTLVIATLMAIIVCVLAAGWGGLLLLTVPVLVVCLMGRFVVACVGGITGDTIGAATELSEAAILLSIFILETSKLWQA